MISADAALIDVINRTAVAYVQNAPAYITYREFTTAKAQSLGRSQSINRYVAVRQADDFAVMRDLPSGGERTGKAFPIIPYFDPLSQWSYSWFANLKNVNIDLTRYPVGTWPTPAPATGVAMSLTYVSFWAPSYAPDSTGTHLHLRVMPTPALQSGQFYPYDLIVDPVTRLPSHIDIRFQGNSDEIALDYKVLENHWTLTQAIYTAQQHALGFSFVVVSDTQYQDITFPAAPPDPRLAGPPAPTPTPPHG